MTINERNKIAINNIKLVKSIARKMYYPGCPYEYKDLVSIGFLGLLKAINKYDPNKKGSFGTYAYMLIKGSILDEMRESNKNGRYRLEKYKNLVKAVENEKQKRGKAITYKELARAMNISEDRLHKDIKLVSCIWDISLGGSILKRDTYKPIESYRDKTIENDSICKKEARKIVNEMVSKLPKKEKDVVELHIYAGKTQVEISKLMGVSNWLISRIYVKTKDKLRRRINRLKNKIDIKEIITD